MFRHVVMFRWSDDSTAEQQAEAIMALDAFRAEISDLGALRVGADEGLSDGNFDAVVVADFADRETYLQYASDPRHLALVSRFIKPILGERAAVQTELA